ncbi:MAG: hypothetical protein CSB44_00985 [Gammaproteobacteria bacterium]|nr:MAG: hypothetical protein CSB44_00985 [Gammaproteobacteria bacterium]
MASAIEPVATTCGSVGKYANQPSDGRWRSSTSAAPQPAAAWSVEQATVQVTAMTHVAIRRRMFKALGACRMSGFMRGNRVNDRERSHDPGMVDDLMQTDVRGLIEDAAGCVHPGAGDGAGDKPRSISSFSTILPSR